MTVMTYDSNKKGSAPDLSAAFFWRSYSLLQSVLLHEALIQLLMLVGQIDLTTLDEGMGDDAAAHVEDITFANDDVRILACFNGTGAVADAQNPRGIEGNGRQGFFLRQSVGGCGSSIEGQVLAAVLAVGIIDGEEDTCFLQMGCDLVGLVDIIVTQGRELMHLIDDDGDLVQLQQIGDLPAFATPDDDYIQAEFLGEIDGYQYLTHHVTVNVEFLGAIEQSAHGLQFEIGLGN